MRIENPEQVEYEELLPAVYAGARYVDGVLESTSASHKQAAWVQRHRCWLAGGGAEE